MKRRIFAVCLLSALLLTMQTVIVQAAPEDSGATQLDKFPDSPEKKEDDPSSQAKTPEDGGATQLDKFTGEEVGKNDTEVGGNRVRINDTVEYDREKRAFVHSTPREQVYSNVASGMTTTEFVWLSVPMGAAFHLYKDGERLESTDFSGISEPGAYTLISDEINDRTEIMHFTVVAPVTGQLSRFQLPEGFAISTAMCNGSKIPVERTYVDLAAEGEYDISYRCPISEMTYLFRVTVDHTPPVLALAEVMEDGTAKGPVDISDLEEGAQIGIWLNNKEISYRQVLTQSGKYRIVVTDAAGNRNDYSFTIRTYYTTNSIVFFVAVIAVAAGMGIYALVSRRHMRIR